MSTRKIRKHNPTAAWAKAASDRFRLGCSARVVAQALRQANAYATGHRALLVWARTESIIRALERDADKKTIQARLDGLLDVSR